MAFVCHKSLGIFQKGCKIITKVYVPKHLKSTWTTDWIRSSFIAFFKENNHTFIPSSPVAAWNDRDLDFVNAGMNQFKSIFLGSRKPSVDCAVNYQKCIRVGGKHNDLDDVGKDTYHHTFFEMLGNWSFQSYTKEEACRMSWELLTKVYKIPSQHLYVTYFGGDTSLNLPPDYEVKEIWKCIGIPQEKILPFGMKENFWDMGDVGPCGPCTEIHYERQPTSTGASMVNQGSENLIELWNIVFIQYQRTSTGSIIPLDSFHVDTGMGLERLAACLNGRLSNYDTDLFLPLFDCIHKLSSKHQYEGNFSVDGNCLDTYYRILADHSRMITVALADGLLPQDSENLRRVIRRSLLIGQEKFGLDCSTNWLGKVCEGVACILGHTYPELHQNLGIVKCILDYEAEVWREAQSQISTKWPDITKSYPELASVTNLSPQLIGALNHILPKVSGWKKIDNNFPPEEALEIWKKFTIKPDVVRDIIRSLNFKFNYEQFLINIENERNVGMYRRKMALNYPQNVSCTVISNNLVTDDHYKYDYTCQSDGLYNYKSKSSTVTALLSPSGTLLSEALPGEQCGMVTSTTNFYCHAGGQNYDTGTIQAGSNTFKVNKVHRFDGCVVHSGTMVSGGFRTGDEVVLNINSGWRLANSKHHTAHHLFLAALRFITGGMAFQRKSSVSNNSFVLDVFSHPPLDVQHIYDAEIVVKLWISKSTTIEQKSKFIFNALREDSPHLVSGEKYPDDVRIIATSCELIPQDIEQLNVSGTTVRSSELCCGTHIFNTSHLGAFAISDIEQQGNGITRITGLCDEKASQLNTNVGDLKNELDIWEHKITEALRTNCRLKGLRSEFKKWKQSIQKLSLPATFHLLAESKFQHLDGLMDRVMTAGSNLNELLTEFQEVVSKTPYGPVIHLMKTEYRGNLADLETIIKEVADRPAAFVCSGWGRVRACVFIPKQERLDNTQEIQVQTLVKSLVEADGSSSTFRTTTTQSGEIGVCVLNGVKHDKVEETKSAFMKKISSCIGGS